MIQDELQKLDEPAFFEPVFGCWPAVGGGGVLLHSSAVHIGAAAFLLIRESLNGNLEEVTTTAADFSIVGCSLRSRIWIRSSGSFSSVINGSQLISIWKHQVLYNQPTQR
ncbi:hypothetical protein [Streptomyces scopuliridis]|uniref:hypothetical protein n=1 Tax=Streptomyces scopuliridis TaxID=452529 RepID=UPI001470318E|nr:hypothetical protein [Streptomyces scopuliridis]